MNGDDSPSSAEPTPAIEVEDLTLSFGDARILESVSATVPEGELLGLVGPNGAGKTTLLRAISGALDPDDGRAFVGGDAVHDLPSSAASRRVAVVPQATHLSFSFDVRDVVEMGRHPHQARFDTWTQEDREAVDRALERTRTAEFADRSIDEVSGGERQRVLLARALAQDAPVLLLDEPTASLDLNHAIETMELVRELVDDGRTAVAAIHDLELAARYCDRVALLSEGDLVATGAPEDVFESEQIETAFEARTAIEPSPVGGGLSIAALPDAADGPRVHVVGGGEPASTAIGALGTAGADLSVGPVVRGDRAVPTAASFDADVIETPRFGSIGGEDLERAREAAAAADACVLVADHLDGAGDWLAVAEAADAIVLVDGAPPAEHVADRLRDRFERLRNRASTAAPNDVAEAIQVAVESEASPPTGDAPRSDGGRDGTD